MKNKLLVAALLGLSIAMPLSSCATKPILDATSTTSTSEVSKASITISGENSVIMGDNVQLNATVKNLANFTLAWKSSDPSIASVDSTGLVSTVSSIDEDVEITITCEVVGQANIKASHKLTVKKDDSSDRVAVSISGEHNVNIGKSITLTATVKNATDKSVTWTSSNESIATVKDGVVTAKTNVAQSTSITIKATSNQDTTKYALYIVNVVVPGPVKVTVSGADHVTMGKSVQLTCSIENAYNEEITWTSSNESIATVKDGKVTALVNDHNTQVTITATSVQDTTKSDSHTLAVWVGEKESDDVYVEQITINENFALFESNKNVDSSAYTGFLLKDKDHLIGDDNAADFKPVTVFGVYNKVTEDLDTVDYKGDWIYDITISENVNGKLTKIADDSPFIDGIDNVNCLIDFNDSAIGHKFEVKVEPGKLTAGQKNDEEYDSYYVVKYNVAIVDGFNVYKPEELAYIDDRDTGIEDDGHDKKFKDDGKAWKAFKEAHHLKANYYPNALVLQTNISLTLADIPDRFYWNKGDDNYVDALNNSLHDNIRIYERRCVNDGGNFSIHGNYFAIDASKLPLVKYDDDKPTNKDAYIVSDAYLFEFRSVTNYVGDAESNVSTSLMEDLYLKGNGSRNENAANSGSLIMLANNGNNSVCRNVISISWYQSFSGGINQYNSMSLQYCKGYDDFTGFVFGYNVHSIIIDHCEFSFSGGPCIIAQDWIQDNGAHKSTNVTITNSDIQCYVNGREGWFQGMGVLDEIKVLKSLDPILYPRSFLKTLPDQGDNTYMNLVCIHMDSKFAKAPNPILGSCKIDNGQRLYCGDQTIPFTEQASNADFEKLYLGYCCNPKAAAPVLQSSEGGFAYFDGVQTLRDANDQPIDRSTSKLFKGDYLAVYFLGMMITLGYYNA